MVALPLLWDGTPPTKYEYAGGPWRPVIYIERDCLHLHPCRGGVVPLLLLITPPYDLKCTFNLSGSYIIRDYTVPHAFSNLLFI